VVIHPDKVRVSVKSDWRWSHLKRRLTLESQAGGVPDGGTREMSEKRLNMTTNLEGGKGSRKKVSSERVVFDFILQLSNRFLVPFDSFASNNTSVPPDAPRCRLEDRCCQVVGRVGKVAQHVDGHGKELKKMLSHDLLSSI
jgi:hypothetical protein